MIFWRGLRWRRGFAVAVLLVGAIGAGVAALGPLYARAATESALTDELRSAGPDAGLSFLRVGEENDARFRERFAAQVGPGAHRRGFRAPIFGESVSVNARAPRDSVSTPTSLVYRTGLCRHVVVVAGHCPSGPGQAMVPAAAPAGVVHWALGTTLTARQPTVDDTGAVVDGPTLATARVTGIYRPRDVDATYWFGRQYFASAATPALSSALKQGADAIFVSSALFDAMAASGAHPTTEFSADVEIDPSRVRLDDLPTLRHDLALVQHRFPRQPGTRPIPAMRTMLLTVLAQVDKDRRAVQAATLVVVLELAALSLLVLFQVVNGAVSGRGDEIALAKLRGLRPAATVRFALGEPVALLLLAAPLGFLLADVTARILAARVLLPGSPVVVTAAAAWALLAAFAGSAAAAALGATRTLTRPVLEQWRNTSPRPRGQRTLLAVDLALAAAAVAAVVALRAGDAGRPRAVFLVAPALVVFAVALLGTRLVPVLLRRRLERSRASRRVATFVALRQTVRRPGGLRLAVLLAVAAGLATFAVCGEAVARGNRAARAETEIGAPRTLAVLNEAGHDPQTIVDAVDPHGRWAGAVASWSTDGGPDDVHTVTGLMLGVEPSRLAATGYAVRGQVSPATIARDIVDRPTPPVARFVGQTLSVTLDTTSIVGDRPVVRLGYRIGHSPSQRVVAQTLLTGRHTYTAPMPCTAGCAFTGVSIDRSVAAADSVHGSLTVESVRAGPKPLAVRLTASAWRGDKVGLTAGATFRTTARGVHADFHSTGGSVPVLTYADSPRYVPLVTTPTAPTTDLPTGGVSDYSKTIMDFRIMRRASPLPVLLSLGSIGDLDYLRQRLPNFDRESSWSVWLGPAAPADAVARLRHAGLLVQHGTTAAARVGVLGRQGPALGLLLLLVCAVAAALLAAGGTAVALLAESRRRSFELAALRAVGVRQVVVRRSAVLEQLLLLGAAAVLGLASGYAAALTVLPVIPEFADSTPVVTRYGPPLLLSLGAAAGFVLLLAVTAVTAGSALARSAVPSRLRESAR